MNHDQTPVTKTDLEQSLGVLIEHFDHQFDRVGVTLNLLEERTRKIPDMDARLERLGQKVSTIELVVTATNHDLQAIKKRTDQLEQITTQHDKRLTKLETKTT